MLMHVSFLIGHPISDIRQDTCVNVSSQVGGGYAGVARNTCIIMPNLLNIKICYSMGQTSDIHNATLLHMHMQHATVSKGCVRGPDL